MTLNGVMAVTLRYFSEVGKPALQKTICGGIHARVYCIFSACTMSSQRKFTFAISSPDEFLVHNRPKTTEFGEITQLRRLRSFKVADFATSRKLICNCLLVINNNIPPSYRRLLVKFSLATGECLTLTPSLGVILCEYPDKLCVSRK